MDRCLRAALAAAVPPLAAIGLLAASASAARAQVPSPPVTQYIVDFWREESGLPQNYVSVILQDRQGYIWVGTRSGLARFDGVRFTTYDDRKPGQLRESEVWALTEGSDGAIWAGTYGGGLTRLADGKFTTYTVDDGLPGDLVTALETDADGSIWVGTTDGLARREHGAFTVFKGIDALPGGPIRALFKDRHGVVWIGTDEGLASYANGRFTNHTAAHPKELTGLVSCITRDTQDRVWVGIRPPGTSGDGVRRLDGNEVVKFDTHDGLPSNIVMSIVTLEDGTVWIGTREGLTRYTAGRFETYFSDVWGLGGPQMLERASVQGVPSLASDREGNLWFGTRLDGLGRMRVGLFQSGASGEPGGQGVDVRTVQKGPDGSIWLGTAHDLRHLHDGTVTKYAFGSRSGYPVDAITTDRQGTILLGSSDGLWRFKDDKVSPYPLAEAAKMDVGLLFTDSAGGVWIGSRDRGAYRLEDGVLKPFTSKEGLLGNQVRGIAEDRHGGIWIGTRDGGVTCVRDGAVRKTFGMREGLSGPTVQAIFADREGTVWVATRQGLNRITGDRVVTLTAQQGLPANYFYQIVEDEAGQLWLTYARGIARISRAELNAVADGRVGSVNPVLFGTDSGMASTMMTVAHQPSVLSAPDGRLWFATGRGVEVLDPRFTVRNVIPPPVRVEQVFVDRKPVEMTNGMTIEPTRGEIAIHFTALSFVAPNRVLFKYRLEGFDPDWAEVQTRRVAYYSNLPHGTYRFRVIACNNDGVWNEAGASLSFTVLPRWHERTWVRLLGLGLLVCLVLGTHRVRVAGLRQRERELGSRVEERTRALQELTASLERRVSDRTAELESANQALLAERERLAVTLGSIGDGVIATDVDSRVVLMNRVAEHITGWTAAEAAGRPLGEVFRTVDRVTRAPLPDPAAQVLARGSHPASSAPCLLQARDGREVVVADSVAPIRDPESRVVGAVFVFRDVTERERIDEQLRNTQRLEALGVLAGGIAHDFNNLLTGIFGFVEVAQESDPGSGEARDMLQRAMGVLDKARGLTRQLLTFSKAGEPVRTRIDLGPPVRDAVGFVLSGSNVVADVRIDPHLWPCEVDEQQFNQVVDNLVMNARQAMASGGTITVTLANVQVAADLALGRPAGAFVRLSVRDQGPGVPREMRSKIFEPFFTTKAGGTGLGLATVFSIVRRHQGFVEVEDHDGPGATFTVLLPAAQGPAAPAEAAEEPAVEVRHEPAGGRILVMDDEDHVREVARQMLKRLGYEPIMAGDDREAVAALERARERGERVSAAILDITIPGGLGGAAALECLRAVAPGLPAIASSGYSGDALMAHPAEQGFDGALPKPYTLADLRAVLAAVLNRADSAR